MIVQIDGHKIGEYEIDRVEGVSKNSIVSKIANVKSIKEQLKGKTVIDYGYIEGKLVNFITKPTTVLVLTYDNHALWRMR